MRSERDPQTGRVTRGATALAAWSLAAVRAVADTESTPLGVPIESTPIGGRATGGADPFSVSGYLQTLVALALVLGLMLLAAAVFKRFARSRGGLVGGLGPGGPSPSGVLEVLGRYPLGGGRTLVLLRFDRRVLLLHQGGGRKNPTMTTLSEVGDADEVASIMLKTRQAEDERADGSFREAIRQMERGFEEPTAAEPAAIAEEATEQHQLDLLVGDPGERPASAIRRRLRDWAGAT